MFTNFFLDNTTHDLVLDDSNQLRMTKTPSEDLACRIESRLKTFKGEWFLDRELGIPYYGEVLKKNPDVTKIRGLLLAELVKVSGIAEVLRFEVEFIRASRTFQLNFSVKSSDGEVVEGEI
jgi:hypothetical protein